MPELSVAYSVKDLERALAAEDRKGISGRPSRLAASRREDIVTGMDRDEADDLFAGAPNRTAHRLSVSFKGLAR